MTPDECYTAFLDDVIGPLPESPGDAVSPDADPREHWQIDTDDAASWALRKIAQAQAVVQARLAFIQREQARQHAWLAQAEREAERTTTFFEGALHGYLLRLREAGRLGTKKSWSLPQGTLQLRAVGERWEVQDPDALQRFAEDRDVTTVTIAPDMAAIRALCASGHEVPGMVLARQGGEAFRIRFATKDGDV